MAALGLKIIDKSVQDANIWLVELMGELGWHDKKRAYRLLRAGLHTLRDSLRTSETAHLSAQLPTFLRGVFYDGWDPDADPVRHKHEESFIEAVEKEFAQDPNIDPEETTRAFLRVIANHVSEGEVDDVKSCLSPGVKSLWPDQSVRSVETV